MKICWDNLKGIYLTRKTKQFKKGSNTYIEKICIICNNEFLAAKYKDQKYCSSECGAKSKKHYSPIIEKVNKERIKERTCNEYKYYDNPNCCIICNKILTYDQSILRKCKCCSHSCSQKQKWKDEQYANNFSAKIIKNWDEKLNYNHKEWREYKLEARKRSSRNYRKYKKHINSENLPIGKGEGKFNVDHKFSVYEGFLNNIDYKLISHPNNLQILTAKENITKGYKSSITKNELLKITESELYKK